MYGKGTALKWTRKKEGHQGTAAGEVGEGWLAPVLGPQGVGASTLLLCRFSVFREGGALALAYDAEAVAGTLAGAVGGDCQGLALGENTDCRSWVDGSGKWEAGPR